MHQQKRYLLTQVSCTVKLYSYSTAVYYIVAYIGWKVVGKIHNKTLCTVGLFSTGEFSLSNFLSSYTTNPGNWDFFCISSQDTNTYIPNLYNTLGIVQCIGWVGPTQTHLHFYTSLILFVLQIHEINCSKSCTLYNVHCILSIVTEHVLVSSYRLCIAKPKTSTFGSKL